MFNKIIIYGKNLRIPISERSDRQILIESNLREIKNLTIEKAGNIEKHHL